MLENVNARYRVIFNRTVTDPAQIAKAKIVADFTARGEITEVGRKRLDAMDMAGVDVQILSYGNNNPRYLPAKEAVSLGRQANDDLAGYCKAAPVRLYGFAALPVADVDAAVEELVRCVTVLGFKIPRIL